jgi:hypothetical protein
MRVCGSCSKLYNCIKINVPATVCSDYAAHNPEPSAGHVGPKDEILGPPADYAEGIENGDNAKMTRFCRVYFMVINLRRLPLWKMK